MQRFVPSETALVLGGGGAKGAYEIGVIEALEHLGIRAASVYGASIGALNAALYAQGDLSLALDVWDNIRLSDVVSPESVALAEEAEGLFDHPEKLLDFITRNAQKKGVDITPFSSMLRRCISEDLLRRSSVRFGLVATRFPSMSIVEKQLGDMAPGTLHDWLMASCACYPALPMQAIGDQRYIDGGYCDNVPVDMAIRAGAKRIIAVDIGRSRAHAQYDRRPNVTYIRAFHPLGGLMTFDPERSRRNRILGYNDTLRAFGHLRGTHYAFDPIDAQALRSRAQDFVCKLTLFESQQSGRKHSPLFALLEESLRPGADAIDYFLRACELCAQALGADPARVYTLDTLAASLRERLPLDRADAMLGSLLGGRIGVLFAPPQPDRALVLSCLYRLLQRESGFSPLAMRTLKAFPLELLCALTLKEIL
ncbi:MAG: patatin-like phospholipase family protein [Clostridia bacterium]|nr:patatin-like phospholipase family protein [Clostridia bacterium]